MKILVVNCGSSSLKYQLIDMEREEVLASGKADRIGDTLHSEFTYTGLGNEKRTFKKAFLTHEDALRYVIKKLTAPMEGVISSVNEIDAVGHRVVNGGPFFSEPTLVTNEVLYTFKNESMPYAPLHNPKTYLGIKACVKLMPEIPHVLVFDTMFHQTMPPEAYLYGVPLKWYHEDGVRRYGAHGMSHEYVTYEAAKLLNKDVNNLNMISCHLGNGSSITAIKNGRSIDTSMGFTPLEGVIMGTRCGNIDPEIIQFEMKRRSYSPNQIFDILNNKSGLYALANGESDLRAIWDLKEKGDANAIQAINSLIYSIKKYIGAYMAVLGRVDCITFEGGIGEHCPPVVSEAVNGLQNYGVIYDYSNYDNDRYTGEVSAPNSKVKMFIIATNEELVIARHTMQKVQDMQNG